VLYTKIHLDDYIVSLWSNENIITNMPRLQLLVSLGLSSERACQLFIVDNLAILLGDEFDQLNETNASFRSCRKHPQSTFCRDLDDSHVHNWLSDNEFLRKYRLDRDTMECITNLIKGDLVFKKGKRGPKQIPVKHQLMIFLHFMGKEGESNSSQRDVFNISEGHCELCRERVATALCNLREEYIKWPGVEERKEISCRILNKFQIPNCVGMMDGTLLVIGLTPQCTDKADYSGRKFKFSLTVNVINDDNRRI